MKDDPLWFYWGQKRMSYLRYLTLASAARVHDNIVLITRREPVNPYVGWQEKQDFQLPPIKRDYSVEAAKLPIRIIELESFCPTIAALKAPDVQTSDLLAWYILGTVGGTVADMDILFMKPLPAIIFDTQVVQFTGHPKEGYMPVSFMQGWPCLTWWTSFDLANKAYNPARYESCGSENYAGLNYNISEHIVFPWAGHPWSKYRGWLFEAETWPEIPKNCIGLHWYAGHNQDFNQKINGPEDFKGGAMTWAAREVFGEGISS